MNFLHKSDEGRQSNQISITNEYYFISHFIWSVPIVMDFNLIYNAEVKKK